MGTPYTEEQQKDLSTRQYDNMEIGKRVKVDGQDGQKDISVGYVYRFVNDPDTGMQAYIITDKKVESEADIPNVKRVTMLYRGSEGLDFNRITLHNQKLNPILARYVKEPLNIPYLVEMWNDWVLTDGQVAFKEVFNLVDGSPAQFRKSKELLEETMKTFRNAAFDLNGHSLGGMIVQYLISSADYPERIRSGRSYSAPNIYDTLNAYQKKNGLQAKDRLLMFYDPHDLVQMFGNIEFSSQPSEFLLQQKLKEFLEYMPEEEAHYQLDLYIKKLQAMDYPFLRVREAIGHIVMINSYDTGNKVSQHIWGGYQFNNDGSLKLSNEFQNDLDILLNQYEAVDFYDRMFNLGVIKQITKARQLHWAYKNTEHIGRVPIHLDVTGAQSVLISAQLMLSETFSSLRSELDQALRDAETLWSEIELKVAETAQHLGVMEGLITLANAGITYESVVGPIRDEINKERQRLETYEQEYTTLLNNIKSGIQELVQRDQLQAHLIDF